MNPQSENLYHAQEGFANLDSMRQSRTDPQEEPHSQMGKGDQKGQSCKVAASPNSQNLTERGVTFEKAFDQLQAILEKMNSGSLSLQESIGYFEKGEKLMRHCETILKSAEQKIEEIAKGSEGVSLTTVPFSGEEVPF
jgi:exodeoxyribonuclease VII small subunit